MQPVLLWLGQVLAEAVRVTPPLAETLMVLDSLLLPLTLTEEQALAVGQGVELTVPLMLRVKVKDTVGVEAAEDTTGLPDPLTHAEALCEVHTVLLWLGHMLTDALLVTPPLTVPLLDPDEELLLLSLAEEHRLATPVVLWLAEGLEVMQPVLL